MIMSQFIANFEKTKVCHLGQLENSKTDREKTKPSNDDEGLEKDEESISESDSEVSRTRSRRTYFTAQQREALEKAFSMSQYINPKLRHVLASSIGVPDRVVQTWFKNRRVKWRKERKTPFKLFVEPPQRTEQPLVLLPHISYAPVNYHSHLPYYEQIRRPSTTTSASSMAATSTYNYNYVLNSSGENHLQNGYFPWNIDALNKSGEERGDEGRGEKGAEFK